MNAASFFSLDTPAGATVPPATDTLVPSDAPTSGDAVLFAALVDEALVRAGQGLVELPSLEPASKSDGTGGPAIASGAKLQGVPATVESSSVVGEDCACVPANSSDPERPKSEPSQDLNILLLTQSPFVAPTLPVTWVVPSVITTASTGKTGDEAPPVRESAVRGETRSSSEMVEPSRGLPAWTRNVTPGNHGVGALPPESVQLRITGEVPLTDSEPPGSFLPEPKNAKSGQADPSTPIAGPAQSVFTGNRGRLDLIELGFQPAMEVGLPPLAKSLDASVPSISTPTLPAAKLPEPVSLKVEVESKYDGATARPQALSEERPFDLREVPQSPVPSQPVAKVLLPTRAPLPDMPAVSANALRFTTDIVVPVQNLPTLAEKGTPAVAAAESDLPSASGEAAKVAQSMSGPVVEQNAPPKTQETTKAHAGAGFFHVDGAPAQMKERRGTRVAREELRMESFSNAEQAGTGPMTGAMDDVAGESSSPGAGPTVRDRDADPVDLSRNVGATDWQTGRPVSRIDRSAPDSQVAPGLEATRTVEQLSGLVLRETAVLKQHTPDSMAVVLRPDANTELFLHLTQRDGQIEASVRCERGNFDQINALWPQLQESLAGQKVRLAPLQESLDPQRDPQGASGNPMNFSESEQRSRRQSMPEDDSTSDRPSSAPPSTVSLHPERRRSGTRPTASRPGWETWA